MQVPSSSSCCLVLNLLLTLCMKHTRTVFLYCPTKSKLVVEARAINFVLHYLTLISRDSLQHLSF